MSVLQEKSKNYMLQTYAKYPIEIVRGKGSFVWDSNEKKYLDFYSGHAVCLLGHCPNEVIEAIEKQLQKLMFYSNIFELEQSIVLAEKIAHTLLPEKYHTYFANSGSEANEAALKMARKFTGKSHVISFMHAFHGRGMYPLAATGIPYYHTFSPDFNEHTSFAELGNMESVEKAYTENTAAIICEPIQSIGGANMADEQFYKDLAQFCEEKNIVLIFDEIQTGLGRTGEFWLSKSLGVVPHIITTAKGIASGLPLSAVMVHEKVSQTIQTGEHATTFGGGPVVCAAANATFDVLLSDGFLDSVKQNSTYMREKLSEKFEIFGKGFLTGVKVPGIGKEVVKTCMDNGLIIGSSSIKDRVRVMPPLNVTKEEIDMFLSIFFNHVQT